MTAAPSIAPPPAGTLRITELDEAWKTPPSRGQLRAVRTSAERLKERFTRGPRAIAVRTLPLGTLPCAATRAFDGASLGTLPWCLLTVRAMLVQFFQGGDIKNLLFGATDLERAFAAPELTRGGMRMAHSLARVGASRFEPLESQLRALGLAADDIDFLAFADFQMQDVRGALGDGTKSAQFRNAVLLAPRAEWEDWADMPPLARGSYVARGREGVDTTRVLPTTSDLLLGDGVMLLRTPGRTAGHQSLFVHTDSGVWGVSANGVCADSWSPLESKNARLKNYARTADVEVVTSGGGENSRAQYTSMVLERSLADRVPRAPGFVQMFPWAELTASAFAPGLTPTLLHRAVHSGTLARSRTH